MSTPFEQFFTKVSAANLIKCKWSAEAVFNIAWCVIGGVAAASNDEIQAELLRRRMAKADAEIIRLEGQLPHMRAAQAARAAELAKHLPEAPNP